MQDVVTYVAPTVFNLRNWGVNWYRTNRPAFGSGSSGSPSGSDSSGSRNKPNQILIKIAKLKTHSHTCMRASV